MKKPNFKTLCFDEKELQILVNLTKPELQILKDSQESVEIIKKINFAFSYNLEELQKEKALYEKCAKKTVRKIYNKEEYI